MEDEHPRKKGVLWPMRYVVMATAAILAVLVTGCLFRQAVVKRSTPYIIAYPSRWSSIQLYGTEQSVIGFSSDLMFEISRVADIPIRLIMANDEHFPALLEEGTVDGVLTSIPDDVVTEQFYEFTNPYFVSGYVIVVAANSSFNKLDDLKNGILGYDYSEGIQSTLGAKDVASLKNYDSMTKALDDVVSGTIDGVILNFLNANRLKRSLYRSRIRIILPPITTQALRLAVMRGKNHELIKLFDDGIRKFVKSGKYKELLDYWGIELELPLEEKAAAVPAK
jgi:polar amino acid transport system substrate-binding protein